MTAEESRYYLILARGLDYGDVSELKTVLVQVSKLLEAYLPFCLLLLPFVILA